MFYDERLQEKRGEISPSCLPIPILVLCHQPFVQFPVIFRKGQPITLAHGLFVHQLHADAAFHAGHYGNNVRKPVKQPKVKEEPVAVSEVIEEVIENVPITEEISDTGIATEHMEVEEAPTRPDCTKKSFMQKFLDRLEKLMEE